MRQIVRSRARAFTLVELLTVVAIVVLLLSLLVPTLGRAKRLSKDMICHTQVHQIGLGFMSFAADHKSTFPGSYAYPYAGVEPWQKSWMGNEVWSGANYEGTLVRYIGPVERVKALYRCPDLAAAPLNSGLGSNGYFDYSSVLRFSGARAGSIPLTAKYLDVGLNQWHMAATPLVVEEDYAFWLNYGHMEPGHSSSDRMGHWHVGNHGNYLSPDGSACHLYYSTLGPSTYDWRCVSPRGQVVDLTWLYGSDPAAGFGEWMLR